MGSPSSADFRLLLIESPPSRRGSPEKPVTASSPPPSRPLTLAAAAVLLSIFLTLHVTLIIFHKPLAAWSNFATPPYHSIPLNTGPQPGGVDGVNSLSGTTGVGAAEGFFNLLSLHPEELQQATTIGSAPIVEAFESRCGFNMSQPTADLPCLEPLGFVHISPIFPETFADQLDIIIPTIRNLNFLEQWRAFLEPYHLIILQDGDPSVPLSVPPWCDFELHTRTEIEATLKENAWIISTHDSSLRAYGFLVSRKRYIYTIDDDTLPLPNGENPVALHMRNLLTNSTPHYFNTLYDPFAPGKDFVRGYPYSLRAGVPTAISHGLWLNVPDYDAVTQLLKMGERNTAAVAATLTIPKGTQYPMCGMNLAFHRERVGVLMLFGLMGDGQPWGRYDDMLAGWLSKVCIDSMDWGVKSGAPFTWHNKASNPFVNLKKEFKGYEWQEHMVRLLDGMHTTLSPAARTSPAACYLEVAGRVEQGLNVLNPYFPRFAQAMRLWVGAWEAREAGTLLVAPPRSQRVRGGGGG